MGMQIESEKDLVTGQNLISRRKVLGIALALGAAACAPSSPASEPSTSTNRQLPADFPDSDPTEIPATPTPELVTKDINFTTSIIKGIYPDEISPAEWAEIGAGKNIPLPFGVDALPFTAMSVERIIDAKSAAFYDRWVGNKIEDYEIGYKISPGAILYAYMDCAVFIYPEYSPGNPYYDKTTRIELLSTQSRTSNVFVIGGVVGKGIELLADVPVYRTKPSILLKAGTPILSINNPAFIPSSKNYLLDLLRDFPNNLHVRQSAHDSSALKLPDFYRQTPDGRIIGSDMSTKSFRRDASGKFVSLNSPAGK